MRLFACQACRQTLRFDSTLCENWRAVEQLTQRWLPLKVGFNSVSSSMGHPDLHPSVLSAPALEKLAFVHALVHPAVRR